MFLTGCRLNGTFAAGRYVRIDSKGGSGMYSTVVSASINGIESRRVIVEADVSDGLPTFSLVGFLASETREAAERVRSALRNSGVRLSPQHVTINLAPASFHKDGALFDLAIAIALMGGYGFFPQQALNGVLLLGELSLNGEIGPVRGVLEIVSHAKEYGCGTVIVPSENLAEGSVVREVNVLGAENLNQVIHFLAERTGARVYPVEEAAYEPPLADPGPLRSMKVDIHALREAQSESGGVDFSLIRGQALMRRAAEIAVSGFHNLLMVGPPGAGKSLTARCIASILPQTSLEEALEITKIHSIAGTLPKNTGLMMARPFRAPHHNVTAAALCGGGKEPSPGEISLAHRGILYLDELPEFDRSVLEMLRGPLEDGSIRIARVGVTYTFPAEFMLIASMNPCQCGYFPDRSRCTCTNAQVKRYLSRISMPLLDRIDMCVEADRVKYEELTSDACGESSSEIRQRVMQARAVQQERYRGTRYRFNSDLDADAVRRYCEMEDGCREMMRDLYERMHLTARSYHRILKTARTIADLDHSEQIRPEHIAEAVQYRCGRDIFG